MTSLSVSVEKISGFSRVGIASLLAFALLFSGPMAGVAEAWWTDPQAGHGLLLAPLAVWLAYRIGVAPDAEGQVGLGSVLVFGGVLVRVVAALAAEAFGARLGMMLCAAGLIVSAWGAGQLYRWWLPTALMVLSIPLPEILLGSLSLPLQFQASKLGAALLGLRGIPVRLDGNVIRLPGRELFITEACSGLRSLTALLSLGVLIGGLWLRRPLSRVVLALIALPVAVLINGVRVFLTGFLSVFVGPETADGFTHLTEGWVTFVIAFLILGALAWLVSHLESRRRTVHA